jgi:hypothetical protein
VGIVHACYILQYQVSGYPTGKLFFVVGWQLGGWIVLLASIQNYPQLPFLRDNQEYFYVRKGVSYK